MNVLGCTKIFRGCTRIISQNGQDGDGYTNQFLLQDQIPDFSFPFRGRFCEFRVEFLGTLPIGGTLADLKFDQEFSNDTLALGQELASVELGSCGKLQVEIQTTSKKPTRI